MPCHDHWSLTGLVGPFLNLTIAFLLLCTSLFIHVVLRSLGFLGFSLPSFHNGRFGDPNMCIEGDLVASASERISSVDRLIKSKIPFGSSTSDDDDDDGDSKRFIEMKLVRKNSGDVSNARVKDDETDQEDVSRDEQNVKRLGGFNLMTVEGVKGKRFVTRRSRKSLKNPRRCRVDYESLDSVSSSDAFDETVKHPLMQPYDHVFIRRSNDDLKDDDVKTEENIGTSHWPVLEKTVSPDEQVNSSSSANLCLVRNVEEKTVKELEESLKQERAARAAISVELDKERSAAASAADEAMAMIHRLQDEKAAIEMEAMQFQRMVEEKSTFDAEEMVILKDILIRREREKHFLEKEVEAYRDLLTEAEESECSLPKEKQKQEPQERRALLVKEHDGTVLEMPYREDKNRYLYTSDSEVAYSRGRDVHMMKDETEKVGRKKKLEESSLSDGIIVSGIARKLPPLCRPRKQSLSSSGSRRKSMSAVDYERLKIENEVELLRERLKAVQEERKELTRRASLPPLSSKVRVTPKNRGWRRSSMDLHSS